MAVWIDGRVVTQIDGDRKREGTVYADAINAYTEIAVDMDHSGVSVYMPVCPKIPKTSGFQEQIEALRWNEMQQMMEFVKLKQHLNTFKPRDILFFNAEQKNVEHGCSKHANSRVQT